MSPSPLLVLVRHGSWFPPTKWAGQQIGHSQSRSPHTCNRPSRKSHYSLIFAWQFVRSVDNSMAFRLSIKFLKNHCESTIYFRRRRVGKWTREWRSGNGKWIGKHCIWSASSKLGVIRSNCIDNRGVQKWNLGFAFWKLPQKVRFAFELSPVPFIFSPDGESAQS